jgi:endonuclease-8
MPEGDTIHKLAALLRAGLLGQRVERVHLARGDGAPLCGQTVAAVRSHGKQLCIDFLCGLTLRSHLGLYGSWHRYPAGGPWRKPAHQAGIVLEAGRQVFVCFNPRQVITERTAGLAAGDRERRLGPDLAQPGFEPVVCARRARTLCPPETPALDLLLDQRIAAGIGNVYKSELLFLQRIPPTAALAALTDAQLSALYDLAGELIRRNLGGGRRVTRFAADHRGGLWVYGRRGQACFTCGSPIRGARLGRQQRSTYWCPQCQSAGPGLPPPASSR